MFVKPYLIPYNKGFLLTEWMISLSILSLFLGSLLLINTRTTQYLATTLSALESMSFLHKAKHLALTLDTPTQVSAEDNILTIHTLRNQNLRLSPIVHASINHKQMLGFMPNGHTQFPGTLTLASPLNTKKVSLSVGLAIIR